MNLKIENEEIIKLFNEGLNCSEISRKMGCNPETIRRILNSCGINTSVINNNQLCIYCNSTTQKHGKNKFGFKKYKCNECGKTFNENTINDKNKREDKYNLIKRMYLEDNLSTTEIAKNMGVSSTVIQRIIQKIGISKTISEGRIGKGSGSNLPINDVIKSYTSGNSSIQISNDFNCSKTSVLRILNDNNIIRDNVYNYEHPKTNEIKSLYENMYSMKEISNILNISYSNVNRILHKLNIVRTEDRWGVRMDYEKYLEGLPAFKKYRNHVMRITSKQKVELLNNYDKRGSNKVNGSYHLDHKFSIFEGFKQGIDAEIIGNINNLEFIPWEENLSKGSKCSITKDELFNRVINSYR